MRCNSHTLEVALHRDAARLRLVRNGELHLRLGGGDLQIAEPIYCCKSNKLQAGALTKPIGKVIEKFESFERQLTHQNLKS